MQTTNTDVPCVLEPYKIIKEIELREKPIFSTFYKLQQFIESVFEHKKRDNAWKLNQMFKLQRYIVHKYTPWQTENVDKIQDSIWKTFCKDNSKFNTIFKDLRTSILYIYSESNK